MSAMAVVGVVMFGSDFWYACSIGAAVAMLGAHIAAWLIGKRR